VVYCALPYWNSTPDFDFDLIAIEVSLYIGVPNFIEMAGILNFTKSVI